MSLETVGKILRLKESLTNDELYSAVLEHPTSVKESEKRARRLALLVHPDKFTLAEEKEKASLAFHILQEAKANFAPQNPISPDLDEKTPAFESFLASVRAATEEAIRLQETARQLLEKYTTPSVPRSPTHQPEPPPPPLSASSRHGQARNAVDAALKDLVHLLNDDDDDDRDSTSNQIAEENLVQPSDGPSTTTDGTSTVVTGSCSKPSSSSSPSAATAAASVDHALNDVLGNLASSSSSVPLDPLTSFAKTEQKVDSDTSSSTISTKSRGSIDESIDVSKDDQNTHIAHSSKDTPSKSRTESRKSGSKKRGRIIKEENDERRQGKRRRMTKKAGKFTQKSQNESSDTQCKSKSCSSLQRERSRRKTLCQADHFALLCIRHGGQREATVNAYAEFEMANPGIRTSHILSVQRYANMLWEDGTKGSKDYMLARRLTDYLADQQFMARNNITASQIHLALENLPKKR